MKKVISKSLIILLFIIGIMISVSNIFAKTSNNDWSGLGIIAFVITIIVHCDKAIKYSNNNGFLLSSI